MFKTIKKIIITIFTGAFFLPALVFAQSERTIPNFLWKVIPGTGRPEENVAVFIGTIIKIVLGFVGIAALVVFIIGGIILLVSGGSSEKVEKGRNIITTGMLGLVIVFSAYMVVQFVIRALT